MVTKQFPGKPATLGWSIQASAGLRRRQKPFIEASSISVAGKAETARPPRGDRSDPEMVEAFPGSRSRSSSASHLPEPQSVHFFEQADSRNTQLARCCRSVIAGFA